MARIGVRAALDGHVLDAGDQRLRLPRERLVAGAEDRPDAEFAGTHRGLAELPYGDAVDGIVPVMDPLGVGADAAYAEPALACWPTKTREVVLAFVQEQRPGRPLPSRACSWAAG